MSGGNTNIKNKQGGKNKKRKVVAFLIAMVMLVGVIPVAAFAQDPPARPLAAEAVLKQLPTGEATTGEALPPAQEPTGETSVAMAALPEETPAKGAAADGTTAEEAAGGPAAAEENVQNTGMQTADMPVPPINAYAAPAPKEAQTLDVTVTTNGANSLDVSWTSITGATSYDVYRSEDGTNYALSVTTSRTTFQDTGLQADTQYWYKVVADNGPEGIGMGKTDAGKPQAPFNFKVTGYGEYNNNANLVWDASPEADDYYIYRSTSRDTGYSYVGNSAGATTYNNTGLGYNTTYYYYVTAVKSSVESDPSSIDFLTTGAPVQTVTVYNPTTSSLTVSWSPIPGAGSYTLYRSLDGINYELISVSIMTSYVNEGLQADTHYWYKVVSDNGIEGIGDGHTLPDPKPDAPLNLQAELTGADGLDARLTWNPVAGVDGYVIYRSTTQSGTYSQIGTTQSGTTEYLDAGLDFNATYYYKVTAVKNGQQSDPSNIASVTTSQPRLNVSVSNPTTNSLDVSWNAVPRATSYTVYRSLDGVDYSTLVGTYPGTGFTDTGRDPDTDHWYKVVSSNNIEGVGSGKTLPEPVVIYTVTFDGNGATTPANPSQMTVQAPQTHLTSMPTPPQRTGYGFAGWYTQKNGGTQFTIATAVTGDMTVYARWSRTPVPVSYTVYFDGNGADVQANPTSIPVTPPDTTVKALPTQPARAGYTFSGWNTQADGKGSAFDSATAVTRDMTVYAQWTAVYYRLYFDLNGGSGGAPQTQPLRMGDLAQAVSSPSRINYTFLGWNVSSDGTGAWWDFDTTRMPASDVTLYAQWQKNAAPPAPVEPAPAPPDPTAPPVAPTQNAGEEATPHSPKTGDTANMALWIMLMIAAGGAMAGVKLYARKRARR